ncbi:metalloprotease [Streptomyces sp. SCSIO ZS0520]|uniref:metalloprotease n=1 Tax=Streptomyces sp. SCSIO ZS0520 TaxID=2892996 RepID=UPI0021DB3AC3|nr:metalloprotease [Streptomyces sp. SCSIO ZS0520]
MSGFSGGARRRAGRGRRWQAGGGLLAALLLLAPVGCAGSPDGDGDRVCLRGSLRYAHRDAEAGTGKPLASAPARNANWELWGRAGGGAQPRMLAAGLTGAEKGGFKACADKGGPLSEVHLKFRSSSANLWRVVNPGTGAQYTFESRHLPEVRTSESLGVVRVPRGQQPAWKIVDTLNELYWPASDANSRGSLCWTSRQPDDACEQLTFSWGKDETEGGYFDVGDSDQVVLAAGDADSRHTILHEAGHWLQWQLYGHWLPATPDCEEHTFALASSPGCAWTEGFADAAAAYALGDYRYVDVDGTPFDLRNDRDSDWDRGDAVQGRIGSSLLDLWAEDGPDGGDWDRTIALMSRHRSDDFREYFTVDRPEAGLSTTGEALDIVREHTLDY